MDFQVQGLVKGPILKMETATKRPKEAILPFGRISSMFVLNFQLECNESQPNSQVDLKDHISPKGRFLLKEKPFDELKPLIANPSSKRENYRSFVEYLTINTGSKKQKVPPWILYFHSYNAIQRIEVQTTVLIGKPLTWTSPNVKDEVAWFHQKMLRWDSILKGIWKQS